MVPLRRSFRPRLTIIKGTKIDGHTIGQLPTEIKDHSFTGAAADDTDFFVMLTGIYGQAPVGLSIAIILVWRIL